MILDRVTLTGADDSVRPEDLLPLSREFPFVEWGILFSRSRNGVPRYPSASWLAELRKTRWRTSLKLSAHLCGQWVRDLVLNGNFSWWGANPELMLIFDRIQLNFHAHHHPAGDSFIDALKANRGKEYIFQMDEVNDSLWRSVRDEGVPAVPLFDTSGGAGMLPDRWPHPYPDVYCGYAGGLGPENIEGQLRAIASMARGDAKVWVDMETRVRSEDDAAFDLGKCRRVLEAAASVVGKRL